MAKYELEEGELPDTGIRYFGIKPVPSDEDEAKLLNALQLGEEGVHRADGHLEIEVELPHQNPSFGDTDVHKIPTTESAGSRQISLPTVQTIGYVLVSQCGAEISINPTVRRLDQEELFAA